MFASCNVQHEAQSRIDYDYEHEHELAMKPEPTGLEPVEIDLFHR